MRKTKVKNRWWIKTPLVEDRIILINRVIKKVLRESFERETKTDYEIVDLGGDIVGYRFQTTQNNSYDLEFITDMMASSEVDEKVFKMISDKYKINNRFIEVTDIAFVPSEINLDDRENHNLYTKETNRQEQFELMSRISYLIKEYIKNNPNINIYVIGKNTKTSKLKMYMKVFDNLFSENFIKLEGEGSGYEEGCFYFIKK
jgi:hypothetical protein